MEVKKIVLTGGPCAGKTKILEYLVKELEKEGFYVIVVPETASQYISNNILPNDDREHTLMFQDIILHTQLVKEEAAETYAEFIKDKNNIIILYDRGIMDNRAYFSQTDYDNLLKKYNINELELLDKYDLVIDLISTATLKKDSYELNETRSEDIEKASQIDKLTSLAWTLHKNLKVVKPTEKLEEKADIVLNLIHDLINNNLVSDYVSVEIEQNSPIFDEFDENNSKKISIEHIWLDIDDGFDYVITRKKYNSYTSYALKKIDGDEVVRSNKITQEEYLWFIDLYGIKYEEIIEKIVHIDKGNYFQIVTKDDKVYLETKKENIEYIPGNIVLKKQKGKTLIKQKI